MQTHRLFVAQAGIGIARRTPADPMSVLSLRTFFRPGSAPWGASAGRLAAPPPCCSRPCADGPA